MKTILKSAITTLVLHISINVLSQSSDNTLAHLKDYIWRIEAKGKVTNNNEVFNRKYKVVLFHFDTPVDSVIVKGKSSFKFNVMMDEYYALKIYKKGYTPDVISIWTVLPETELKDTGSISFFETSLSPTDDSNRIRKPKELSLEIILQDRLRNSFLADTESTANKKEDLSYDITIPKY